MSWHIEQKKDAANGETPRGVVNRQRSGDLRMGQPDASNVASSLSQYITHRGQPRELKHLSTWRKRKQK